MMHCTMKPVCRKGKLTKNHSGCRAHGEPSVFREFYYSQCEDKTRANLFVNMSLFCFANIFLSRAVDLVLKGWVMYNVLMTSMFLCII